MKKFISLAFVLWLLSIVLSLFVVGLLEFQMAYASPYTSIDVGTAYNMITNGSYPNLVVLDVRNQSEYDSGHIYGAVWIPVWQLEARIGELAGHENHEIIVYCKAGYRSAIASEILENHTFTKVYNMLGGITAWVGAGYPVWNATVHNVDTTFNYDTIQAAIDAPQTLDGHTILVDAGTYYENVTINKPIALIGENRSTTVIDGNGTGNVTEIIAQHVNVTGFTIRNGTKGILIKESDYNIISENIVTDNQQGIHLYATCPCNPVNENTIKNNIIIKNNEYGILLLNSIDNIIYHNNFINNTNQVYSYNGSINTWDNGYPSGGNYWSNYTGNDTYSGPYQNVTGSDGIGDTPYEIDADNQDNYPLMQPYNGPVRNLNTGESYPTIQEAIDNASEGDTIFALSGTYYEHVTINKSISLIGEDKYNTIVDGAGTGTIFQMTANNITIAGFTMQNSGLNVIDGAIYMSNLSGGNNISHNIITDNYRGIFLDNSSNNTMFGNNITDNFYGIYLDGSSNTISGNNITKNSIVGIILFYTSSNYNRIYGNNITNNEIGIKFEWSSNNYIYHNNFINNTQQVYFLTPGYANFWDDGYPSGGNYWSDYTDVDQYSGPYQNETGSDGIWDHPYEIDEYNVDNYPIVPEFPAWASMLLILIALTVAIAISKRRLFCCS